MRLIDAEALIELINGGYDLDFDEVPETKRELLRMIMEQPTVDAVPVEFIEKEINMTKKGGADMYPHCLTVMLNRWKRAERKEE